MPLTTQSETELGERGRERACLAEHPETGGVGKEGNHLEISNLHTNGALLENYKQNKTER